MLLPLGCGTRWQPRTWLTLQANVVCPTCTGFGPLNGEYREASQEWIAVAAPAALPVRVTELRFCTCEHVDKRRAREDQEKTMQMLFVKEMTAAELLGVTQRLLGKYGGR